MVLIDFWTYTCINCIRTLPHLVAWDRAYRDKGLTIVGVHSPEFTFERKAANVERAIEQNGIRYPVAQDNEMATWNAWSNQYWPAKYLIDARGNVRYAHFGEGDYEETEAAIRALLREPGAMAGPAREFEVAEQRTPETYLGSARAERFLPGRIVSGRATYTPYDGSCRPTTSRSAATGRSTTSPPPPARARSCAAPSRARTSTSCCPGRAR